MSETVKIDLSDKVACAIADAARSAGMSSEEFIVQAAAARALELLDAKAFFAGRAKSGSIEELVRILSRRGGEAPRPGDEAA